MLPRPPSLFFAVLATTLAGACIETGTSGVVDEDLRTDPIRDEEEPSDPRAPVADAGEDQQAAPLQEVLLDGSRSYDPGGHDLIPTWQLTAVPAGSRAVLERADDFRPQFFADLAGTYEISLVVTNTEGLRSKHADVVRVHVVPQDALYVQLTWDTEIDLDLHLVPAGSAVWSLDDCTWCNPNPDWGGVEVSADDPSLDWDAIDGFGPETTTITAPAEGEYRVIVDLYGQGGLTACRSNICPPTTATVDVYMDGERVHQAIATLEQAGELWEAVSLNWPSQRVLEIDQIGWTEIDDCQ